VKIGSVTPAKAAGQTRGSRKFRKSGDEEIIVSMRDIGDNTSILGIPEAELTPHVRHAILALMGEVESLRNSLKHMSQRLSDVEQLADQDPLLPIYNRRAFVRELSRVQAVVARYKIDASLVYIDLNDFKSINDMFGHEAGDYVLSQVAQRLQDCVRDTDIVGRLGGDEFGMILSRTTPEKARNLIDRLPRLFAAQPIVWKGAEIAASLSSGVVAILGDSDAEKALSSADVAMYLKKKNPN